jgi:endonuclease-3 related protein
MPLCIPAGQNKIKALMKLYTLYQSLLSEYGPQKWWPAQTRAEMIIGAILTQNTAWTNVEKALAGLRENNAIDFRVLEKTAPERVAGWIRPAGYFNRKALYIKAFAELLGEYNGSLDQLFRLKTPELRSVLLSSKGIGPETADSILLYAAKRPVFIIDVYTRRFLAAHGFEKEAQLSYDEAAAFFTSQLPADVPLFSEYHALIVCHGKQSGRAKQGLRADFTPQRKQTDSRTAF